MVSNADQTTRRSSVNQGVCVDIAKPDKIGASTPYDFKARNLTAYGGLLPVATMLEKLGLQQLVEETLKIKRQTAPCRCSDSFWGWCWPAMWGSRG
jgi:hypothetical protein